MGFLFFYNEIFGFLFVTYLAGLHVGQYLFITLNVRVLEYFFFQNKHINTFFYEVSLHPI